MARPRLRAAPATRGGAPRLHSGLRGSMVRPSCLLLNNPVRMTSPNVEQGSSARRKRTWQPKEAVRQQQ